MRQRAAGRRNSPAPLILLILAIPILSGGVSGVLALVGLAIFAGAVATAILATALPVLLVGSVAFVAVRRHRRRAELRRGGAAGTAPLPARPAAVPRPDRVWAHAQRRFHGLRAEYAAYECDATAVLRLPALADVSVASTARFVDAFAEAQALETDALPTASTPPGSWRPSTARSGPGAPPATPPNASVSRALPPPSAARWSA